MPNQDSHGDGSPRKCFCGLRGRRFQRGVLPEAFYLATKGGGAFFGKVGSFEEGYEFDAIVLDDSVLPHPQRLSLAERMERAVYLGLDERGIAAKFVAGRKLS